MSASAILSAWNDHVNGKIIHPKLEICLRTYLEKCKNNKHIEAYIPSAKVGIDHLRMLFKFATPSKKVNNTLNAPHQDNQIINENYSNSCSDILSNEKLQHSNGIDLVERPSKIIGGHCIGPASVTNLTYFT